MRGKRVSENRGVILATETPVFKGGGDFLLCELTSGGKTWSFGIPWHATECAMRRCGAVLDAHREHARNVEVFRKPDHG
jgi:hypothetical protein